MAREYKKRGESKKELSKVAVTWILNNANCSVPLKMIMKMLTALDEGRCSTTNFTPVEKNSFLRFDTVHLLAEGIDEGFRSDPTIHEKGMKLMTALVNELGKKSNVCLFCFSEI